MTIQAIGFTLDFIGKILISVSVFLVHRRMVEEQKIDKHLIKEVETEKWITIVGLIFIILGYLMQVPYKV